jgi:ribosomal protein S18 acetylase RimI-like enzyme
MEVEAMAGKDLDARLLEYAAGCFLVFDDQAEVCFLLTRAAFEQRQELLDALLEKAKAEGHTQVSLSVEKDSPAVGFYERNGFIPTGESEGGLVMVRQLA